MTRFFKRYVCSGLVVAVALAGALALRLPQLDKRPMHGDEANQAVRTGLLLEEGFYHYDPNDHHGPTLYFAAWPFCRFSGPGLADSTEWNFRLVPLCFSLLTLVLVAGLGLKRDGGLFPNRFGGYTALTLMAVSPAMSYYSRFFIQESMLVTFLAGMLFAGIRYTREVGDGRDGVATLWGVAFGVFTGLAVATKETVILSLVAAGVATVAACGWGRVWEQLRTRRAAWAIGAAVLTTVVLYTSFFTHLRGLYDVIFHTVEACFTRATGVPEHQHPWNFYLKIIFWFKYGRGPLWSEAGVLLPALVAAVVALWPRGRRGWGGTRGESHIRWVRFVVVYTVVLTLLYSVIPYKTPWCALSFLFGYIVLAGVGAGVVFEWLGRRPLVVAAVGEGVVVGLVALLVWRHTLQAERACFKLPADPRNPYVYAHTGIDAMNLVAEIERSAEALEGYETPIAIAVPTPDTWPLPWYLRKYRQVGYWLEVSEIPDEFKPEIIVAAADQGDVADERFGKGKQANFFGIRPGVLINLFVPAVEVSE